MDKEIADQLMTWYQKNSRPLPWRQTRDPYRIWISEVMLQQTTVKTVVPYFNRFVERFPSVKHLAQASLEEVLELWSGLGYYSRARNLYLAAQQIASLGFPKSFQELLKLPGFGPYMARAVSSLAFDEPVAAVDGNLIRVLSRLRALRIQSWTAQGRAQLQRLGDELMKWGPSHILNQALMDLGSDICTPQKPQCLICPLASKCQAQHKLLQEQLPLVRPRPTKEIWIWKPKIIKKSGQVQLIKNLKLPFLKNQWLFPGTGRKVRTAPKKFSYKHTITRFEIYVIPQKARPQPQGRWVPIKELPRLSPFSILNKAL